MKWDDITQGQIDKLLQAIDLGSTSTLDRVCLDCKHQYHIGLDFCPECFSKNSGLVNRSITKDDLADALLMSAMLRVAVARHPKILHVATTCDADPESAEITIEKLNGSWITECAEYNHFADDIHNTMRAESRALVICAVDAMLHGWFDE
jgi:hypothetical protein